MPGADFKLDLKDLNKLQKFFRKAPKAAGIASSAVLNSLAFKTRKVYIATIQREMNTRNLPFIKRSVIVKKARNTPRMSGKFSEIGSIKRARFSGWVEQETGERTKRTRLINVAARNGRFPRRLKPAFKLKPSRQFPRASGFKAKDNNQRVNVMLQTLGRRRYKKPFVVTGSKKMKSGVYVFKGKKLKMLHNFEPRKVQPKRNPMLKPSVNKVMSPGRLRREWVKALEFQLNRIKR